MKGYLSLIEINMKLAFREKVVLFFNFVFPLVFFFIFGVMMDASQGGVGVRVVSMVLVLGVLGNGLFGAGIRAVVERETNILRRYKVAPISPAPLLVASIVTGWILYLPVILLVLVLARGLWGVEFPERWFALLALLSIGAWAMRAIGLIVASVVNSAQESNVIIQLLYLPMLFLSGATFPLSSLPEWAQVVSQFLPASHLHAAMERIMIRGDGLAENMSSVLSLLASTLVATWISMKIFRWEKEETVPRSAKLWLLVVGLPFLLLGVYEAYSRENIDEAKAIDRELRRNRTRLVRGARIFVGDGTVIESGGLLIRRGKIAAVYDGPAPEPDSLDAEVVEAAGKTVLPGLIDIHVHLAAPGGVPAGDSEYDIEAAINRALAAYLYSGVVAVRSAGDPLNASLAARESIAKGQRLAAEPFLSGPLFTTDGGLGTEYLKRIPKALQPLARAQFLCLPETPEEAREQVGKLASAGVDGITAVMESGSDGRLFHRLDVTLLNAIGAEARARKLLLAVHTGDSRDMRDALDAGAVLVVHGSFREAVPDELFAKMAERGVAYDPSLAVVEAFQHLEQGNTDLLTRSLVEQVAPPGMIEATREAFAKSDAQRLALKVDLKQAMDNLYRAHQAGVTLVAGTDAGNPMMLHGPAIHREMALWVEAGIPAPEVLEAATHNAARVLGAGDRLGLIRDGYDASLLLVDGNPLEDITATERISIVLFRGERVARSALFEDNGG